MLVVGITSIDVSPDLNATETVNDTGTVTVNGVVSNSTFKQVLTDYASDSDSELDIVLSPGTYVIDSVISINKTDEDTSKSVSITGSGVETTKVVFTGDNRINFNYNDGVNVSIRGISFDCGINGGGTIEWNSIDTYKQNDNPSVTPTFTVSECEFESGSAGIGIWDDNGYTFIKAKSEISITGCEFRNLGAGIYMSEESPILNASLLLKDCRFSNISWTGIAGSPVNAHIIHNEFDSTCGMAVQFIINEKLKVPGTETVIEKNVINSVKGIEIMPYHLNEANGISTGSTVVVTEDMLPKIDGNNRDTDQYIVTTVLYRGASDEVLKIAPGALKLDNNYTAGGTPSAKSQYNNSTTNNFDDVPEKEEILSSFESGVSVKNYPTTPNYDAGVGGEDAVPPVTPDTPTIDDDELPFIPGQNVPQASSGSDDKTTLVAAAAAVVVIMLAVVALMATRNN